MANAVWDVAACAAKRNRRDASVQPASTGAQDAAVGIGRHRQRSAIGIGDADHRIIIRWRGAWLEGLEDRAARIARPGAHAGLGIDADQLDAGRHAEWN